MRSVTVGTSTSALFTASASSAWRHRLVVEIEARVEQLPHARLDAVGQLAGDDDQRLLGFRHLLVLYADCGNSAPLAGFVALFSPL